MPTKGLTRKITKKQARSYKRLTPNGLGVTAIAALMNGRRAKAKKRSFAKACSEYSKRYSSTKTILSKGKKSMKKNGKRVKRKGTAFKRTKQYQKMQAGLRKYRRSMGFKVTKPKGRRYRRNDGTSWVGGSGSAYGGADSRIRSDSDLRVSRAGKKRMKAVATAAKRAEAAKKRASAARRRKAAETRVRTAKARIGKRYGKFKSLKAKIGGRTRATYLYHDRKSGKERVIPLWAKMGAKSKKDFENRVANDPKMARKVVATKKRRDRAAARLQLHGGVFTPNKSATVVPFESWSENMKPNRRKKKKSAKRRTAAQKAATRKMIAANRKRSKSGSSPKRRKGAKGKGSKLTKKQRRVAAGKKAARTRKRNAAAGTTKKARKGGKRKSGTVKRRKGTRIKVKGRARGKRRAAIVKALNKRWRRKGRTYYYENRKRHGKRHYEDNKRKHGRRKYRRNAGSMFIGQLKSVAMIGAMVTAGFAAHRVGSYLLAEKGLSQIGMFQSGAGQQWRGVVAGAIVAAAGIGLVSKVAPKQATHLGVGMMVSLLHKTLVTLLAQAGQSDAAGYLSGYPDAEGRSVRHLGYGEYLATNGYGEYLQSGMQGFGAFQQAAAGFGAPMMQAAAGMGAPMMQAAAGVGEYIATSGLRGIGEFEQAAAGVGGMGGEYMDEGIGPSTHAAEYALTQAENMSGIGDIPLLPTAQNAPMHSQAIADAPTGARAGILEGEGGIFG